MKPKELRKRAEEILLDKSEHLKEMSPEEIQHLLEELHTHQIELEIQNEELRISQEDLSKSHARYQDLYHSAPVGYLTLNEKGLIVEANQTIADMLNLPIVKLMGIPFTDFIAYNDQDIFYQLKRRLLENKTPQHCELQLNNQSLNDFWVLLGCNTIVDDSEQIQEIRISISDIADYKLAQEELVKLSKALQYSGEGIMIVNRAPVIEYINPSFTKITGYLAEEVIGRNPNILKSNAQEPAFYKNMWDTINSGEVWHGSITNKKKDGTYYPALMSIAPIQDHKGNITHYVATQTDMTEHEHLENQFREAQKMEAIGVLAGGIAHDFNNILAGIMGYAELAKNKLGTDDPLNKNINTIYQLSMRAAEMIKQLLTFAHKDQIAMNNFSLNSFVTDGLELARLSIPENIEQELNICSEEIIVYGNATQIQQILINLLNNARDALDGIEKPKITCSLQPYYADDAFKQRHPQVKQNQFALLSVGDNGVGIQNEDIDKIFEPFFSTKEAGKGTGLGLSMVYGAIESHNGVIEVDSEVGKGTVFTIYLPIIVGLKGEQVSPERTIVKGNDQLILIADDNEPLREVIEATLINLKFRVISAVDGEDAFNLYEKHKNEICLVILDVIMPKINGVDAAVKIRQLDSTMPIIFATGYDKKGAISAQQQVKNSVILNKPFSAKELSKTINQLLYL